MHKVRCFYLSLTNISIKNNLRLLVESDVTDSKTRRQINGQAILLCKNIVTRKMIMSLPTLTEKRPNYINLLKTLLRIYSIVLI